MEKTCIYEYKSVLIKKLKTKIENNFFFGNISKSPWAHFLLVKAQKVINYRAPLYNIFFVSILVLIIPNLNKIVRAVFSKIAKKCYFGPNLPLLGPKWGSATFFQKSASFTFHHFWIPNSMPNFKKIVRAVFWEKVLRTSGHPNIRTSGRTRVIL